MIGNLALYGLTGGIGSGKSTVATMLRERGVPVLDADVFAREVVEPGTRGHAEVAAAFPEVIGADGAVDRKKLGARIFDNPADRARLEAITHPRIHERALEEGRALERAGHRVVFYEASLLVETGRYRDFDGLVVVTASEEQQIARVQARNGVSREQAIARIQAQLPLEEKRRVATHVIDNSGDLEETRRQVDELLRALGRAGVSAPPA